MRFASLLMPVVCALPAQLAFAEGEALLVKTAEMEIAAGLAQSFAMEMPPEVPALTEGQHYVVMVSADGALTVTTASGPVGLIELTAKPAVLMELYADQLAGLRMMGSMIASQAAMQGGADEAQVNDAIGKIFDFPKQIETLGLAVRGDETAGFKGALELVPVKDTGFASFVSQVKPSDLGAPVIGDGNGPVQFYAAIDKSAMQSMFTSIMEFSAAMGGENSFLKSWEKLKDKYDGTLGFAVHGDDKGMTMSAAIGITDADAINAMYADPSYRKDAEAMMQNAQVKGTWKWDAYEHRGVKVHQSVAEMADAAMMGPNPMMQDGKMTSEVAAVGEFFVMTMNGGEASTKAILDQALDGKVARKQMPANTVMALQLKLRELATTMGGAGADASDAPENVFIDIGANQGAFRIGFQVK